MSDNSIEKEMNIVFKDCISEIGLYSNGSRSESDLGYYLYNILSNEMINICVYHALEYFFENYKNLKPVYDECFEFEDLGMENYFERLNKHKNEYLVKFYTNFPYKYYVLTNYWQAISYLCKKNYNNECYICGSTRFLQSHHKTYKHIYNEIDYMDDLVCLCMNCHKKEHKGV